MSGTWCRTQKWKSGIPGKITANFADVKYLQEKQEIKLNSGGFSLLQAICLVV